jgi:hypothetical protein
MTRAVMGPAPNASFANLTDEDLTAVISYLRTQRPVAHAVSRPQPSFLGRVVKAFILEPRGPSRPIEAARRAEATAEYGGYLANDVANCLTCHTKVDMRSGAFIGPRFAGGNELDSHASPSKKFVTPNLTPDDVGTAPAAAGWTAAETTLVVWEGVTST